MIRSCAVGSMMVMALAAVACGGTDGSARAQDTSAESADSAMRGKKMSLADFKKAMDDVAEWADNDPCSFSDDGDGRGLEVTVTADGKTGTISVAHDATITMTQKNDGDLTTIKYKIGRAGTITVQYADDAFENVEVAPAGGESSTCQIDF